MATEGAIAASVYIAKTKEIRQLLVPYNTNKLLTLPGTRWKDEAEKVVRRKLHLSRSDSLMIKTIY